MVCHHAWVHPVLAMLGIHSLHSGCYARAMVAVESAPNEGSLEYNLGS